MKSIYVCMGNHDGVIGVYSNKKLAYDRAKQYVKNPDTTYSQLCKQMKDYVRWEVEVFGDSGEDVSCRIMKEILNEKY